jgi:uncharacterized RDD family membrane protein YckC
LSQLVTGEAVALDLREAALPSRMLAALIDGALQLVLLFFLSLVFSVTGTSSQAAAAAQVIVILVAVFLGYPVFFETILRGRTPGKAALGLRVVRDDAGPISFRQAFVRGLIGFLVEMPGITFFSAAIVSSLIHIRGKRLGDLAAGTLVIQERVTGAIGFWAPMPPPLAGWATTLELSALPDDLALSVRSFLSRAGQMSETSRADLGSRLSEAVAAVVAPPPPPGTPGWAYLTAVLAERRRRAELAAVPVGVAPAGPVGAPRPYAYGYGTPPPPPPGAPSAPPLRQPTTNQGPPPAAAPPAPPPPPPPAPPAEGGFSLPG